MAKKQCGGGKCGGKLAGTKILPPHIKGGEKLADLVDGTFDSFNAGRLRECCELLSRKVFGDPDVTVGLSISGALTPAGIGIHSIIPLMKAGFIDWITTTGANLYHDTHFPLGHSLHRGGPYHDDVHLRKEQIIRIYDILFDYKVLLETDLFYQKVLELPEFRAEMTTSEMHHRLGKYVRKREEALGLGEISILSAANKLDVPIFAPAPGDSSIGMNMAKSVFDDMPIRLDIPGDIAESASIVYDAKKSGGKSAVFILGGGTPKNFLLQTEPHIQEVLGINEKGHDYFVQITDARPDTGGLSGATPSEAVTWGKIDKERLPDAIVCYTDVSIALPVITSYVLTKTKKRTPKRLYKRRGEMMDALRAGYERTKRKKK